jgi:hypothetical protein
VVVCLSATQILDTASLLLLLALIKRRFILDSSSVKDFLLHRLVVAEVG